MTAEAMLQYLDQPEMMQKLGNEELRTLVVQYPYCQNLRWLLWKKSQIDERPDEDRHRQVMAMYSFNRSLLYKQHQTPPLMVLQRHAPETSGDALVLAPLNTLPNRLEMVQMPALVELEQLMEREIAKTSEIVETSSAPVRSSELDLSMLDLAVSEPLHAAPEEAPIEVGEVLSELNEGEPIALEEESGETAANWDDFLGLKESPSEAASKDFDFEIAKGDPKPMAAVSPSFSEWLLSFKTAQVYFNKEEKAIEVPVGVPLGHLIPLEKKEEHPITLPKEPLTSLDDLLKPEDHNSDEAAKPGADHWQVNVFAPEAQEAPILKDKPRVFDDEEDDVKLPSQVDEVEGYRDVAAIAKGSLEDKAEIITETLADLLAKQGRYENAIRMYEKLMERNPIKSDTFALKIELLKNKTYDQDS